MDRRVHSIHGEGSRLVMSDKGMKQLKINRYLRNWYSIYKKLKFTVIDIKVEYFASQREGLESCNLEISEETNI